MKYVRILAVPAGLLLSAILALPIGAQTCFGTPSRGGLAGDFGKIAFGSSVGATAAYAGSRAAIGAGFHSIKVGDASKGISADGRLALVIRASKLSICPALGVAYEKLKWEAGPGDIQSQYLIATPGLGVGFEFPIGTQFSVTPFGGARYSYAIVKYDFDSEGDAETTGDTLSGPEMQYGLMLRLNVLYGGFSGNRAFSASNPSSTRFFVGVTLPMKQED